MSSAILISSICCMLAADPAPAELEKKWLADCQAAKLLTSWIIVDDLQGIQIYFGRHTYGKAVDRPADDANCLPYISASKFKDLQAALPGPSPVPFALDPGKVNLGEMKLLARLPNLAALEFPSADYWAFEFNELSAAQDLVAINAGYQQLSLANMRTFSALPKLRSLKLYRLKDVHLTEIAKCKALRHLDIMGEELTDRAFLELAKLEQLQSLTTGPSFHFTDAVAPALGKLQALQYLKIGPSNLGDPTLQVVATLPKLQELNLDGMPITDQGLASLRKHPKLNTLSLRGTKITDVGLRELVEIPNLSKLDLGNCPLTDRGLTGLARAQHLRTLNLDDVHVSDPSCIDLAKFPALRSISLKKTRISNAGVQQLTKSQTIDEITLDYNKFTDDLFRLLCESGQLYRFSFAHKNLLGLTDRSTGRPASMEEVQFVDLVNLPITDASIEALAKAKNLKRLRYDNHQISADAIERLSKQLPNCEMAKFFVSK